MADIAPRPWSNLVVEGLWVGAWEARTEVRAQGVTDVISLLTRGERGRRDYPESLPEDVVEHKYDIDDAHSAALTPTLEACLPKIHAIRARGGVVLVHCGAGRSRSPSVALAYLVTYLGVSYASAYDQLVAARPGIAPNVGFTAQLRALTVARVPFPEVTPEVQPVAADAATPGAATARMPTVGL
jgi:predicted protein tyrosine phosphatase